MKNQEECIKPKKHLRRITYNKIIWKANMFDTTLKDENILKNYQKPKKSGNRVKNPVRNLVTYFKIHN